MEAEEEVLWRRSTADLLLLLRPIRADLHHLHRIRPIKEGATEVEENRPITVETITEWKEERENPPLLLLCLVGNLSP